MPQIETVLSILGYDESPHFIRELSDAPTGVYSILRQLKASGMKADKGFLVEGVFAYKTSRTNLESSYQIALCVAKVESTKGLNELRKVVWNTGSIPFLLALSDGVVRLYQTFSYDTDEEALINDASQTLSKLSPINAEEIDTGRIWQSKLADQLNPKQRVDQRLLSNLKKLRDLTCDQEIPKEQVHRLIGKYIYFRYLKDRGILSDKFLESKGLSNNDIFSNAVTLASFEKFSKTLEDRFNGKIFEIQFSDSKLTEETLSLFAEVFAGRTELIGDKNTIEYQLAFDFANYDFEFIPVELLSKVYELFLHAEDSENEDAAYYTPEYLAEYVLDDLEEQSPIKKGMRVLDPACGSGIFLSLAFKRIIEQRLQATEASSFNPSELKQILLESIYGVEINPEAAEVTAFSLILTLLHYVDPPALHRHHPFQFPSLVGNNILNADFFAPVVKTHWDACKFDWVTGNPPWKTIAEKDRGGYCGHWMKHYSSERPIADHRIEHAFAWRALDFVNQTGAIGFVLPSAGWINDKAVKFRTAFLSEATVYKVTNLSHVRRLIFEQAIQPPSVWIYGIEESKRNLDIKHYAPKSIYLPTLQSGSLWAITVSESDIQYIDRSEAATGSAVPWKIAQWGCSLDPMILKFLNHKFTPLLGFLEEQGFPQGNLAEAPQFRTLAEDQVAPEDWEHLPEWRDVPRVNTSAFNRFDGHGIVFSMPNEALQEMTLADCYLRKRGGKKGLTVCRGPHLFIGASWGNAFIFSEEDFIIPSGHYGISGDQTKVTLLKTLASYFSSSLVNYWMFFYSPGMGETDSKNRVTHSHLKKVPVPEFTEKQILKLAEFYDSLVVEETAVIGNSKPFKLADGEPIDKSKRQLRIDREIFKILQLPDTLQSRIEDFAQFTVPIAENPTQINAFRKPPSIPELRAYGKVLVQELNCFAEGELYHRVQLTLTSGLICCELFFESSPVDNEEQVQIDKAKGEQDEKHLRLRNKLAQPRSNAFYLQRNIRMYAPENIQILKPAHQLDWSKTQAYVDAGLVISEALTPIESPC